MLKRLTQSFRARQIYKALYAVDHASLEDLRYCGPVWLYGAEFYSANTVIIGDASDARNKLYEAGFLHVSFFNRLRGYNQILPDYLIDRKSKSVFVSLNSGSSPTQIADRIISQLSESIIKP